MIALKRILVPHDYSDTSVAAATYATALARSFGAELLFLHVGDRSAVDDYLGSQLDVDDVAAGAVRRRVLNSAPANQVPAESRFYERSGNPAAQIVTFASEHEVDLIVMGTHGRGPVAHVVLGSVAERVVRIAPCPVLTVRHPGAIADALPVMDVATEAARAAI